MLASAFAVAAAAATDGKKVTYEDDVLPIFRDNCLKCHNPDKLKGDLDLTSFSSAIKGGGSGATLNAGDPEGSQMFKAITHSEDPTMPPNAKISDRDIATIRKWIEGGLLQGVNSKAIAANRPAVDLTLKSVSVGRPEGPPPMPGALALDPFVHPTHGTALAALAHSPWAPVVALTGARQVVLYRTSDLEFAGVLPFPEGALCDLKFSRNGKLLLASGGRGGHSGFVVVWDITTGGRVITIGDQYDSVLAADLSSDQQWIALGGPDRVLKIYRTKDGGLEHRIKKHTEWITAIEFSPDSRYLATGDRNGGVVLWEAETGQEMATLAGHRGGVTAITWRGDSAMFLSASEDGTMKLWKGADGSALRSINAHSGGVLAARFTHDGRVASCGRDNKIQLWDTSGKNLRTLAFSGDLPNRVTFSDDGGKVLASDWQGRVYVWEAKSGKPLGELDANPPAVADRLRLGADRVAAQEAAVAKAQALVAASETEFKAAQAAAERAAKALSETRAALAAQEVAMKKMRESSPADQDDSSRSLVLAKAAESTKAVSAKLAALQKENAVIAQRLAAAKKKFSEASEQAVAAKTNLAAAQASLARWTAILQDARAAKPTGRRKVSWR